MKFFKTYLYVVAFIAIFFSANVSAQTTSGASPKLILIESFNDIANVRPSQAEETVIIIRCGSVISDQLGGLFLYDPTSVKAVDGLNTFTTASNVGRWIRCEASVYSGIAQTADRVIVTNASGDTTTSANLTFDDTTLALTGNETISGTLAVNGVHKTQSEIQFLNSTSAVASASHGRSLVFSKDVSAAINNDYRGIDGDLDLTDSTGGGGLIFGVASLSYDDVDTPGTSVNLTGWSAQGSVGATGATVSRFNGYQSQLGSLASGSTFDSVHHYEAYLAGAASDSSEYGFIVSGTGDAESFAFYNATDSPSYFGGDVGIGTTPGTRLHVEGDSNLNVMVVDATGTAPNYIFDVRDDGVSQFRVDGAGNVGIGTTTPAELLEVSKNQNNVTAIQVTNENTGSAVRSDLQLANNVNTAYIAYNGTANTALGGANSLNLYNGANAPIAFFTNGTSEKMRITGGGNVGIGTTTPSYELELVSANARIVANTGTVETKLQSSGTLGYIGTITNHDLAITTSNATRVTVDSTGNVGIGQVAPSDLLHIGDSATDPAISLDYANAGSGLIKFRDAGTVSAQIVYNDTVNQFQFDAGGAGLTKMVVGSNGNVGIGTTAPSNTLHVAGSGRISQGASGATASADADELIVEDDDNAGISILTPSNKTGNLFFGDTVNNASGGLSYSRFFIPGFDSLKIIVGGSNSLVLTDSGAISSETGATLSSSGAWTSGSGAQIEGDWVVASDAGAASTFAGTVQIDTLATSTSDSVVTENSGVLEKRTINSDVWNTSLSIPEGDGTKLVSPSLYFDGTNDYLEIADDAKLSFTDGTDDLPFTVSGWIKMADATNFTIASKYASGAVSEWFFIVSNTDNLRVFLNTSSGNNISVTSDSALTSYEGQWVHVAATYSGAGPNSDVAFSAADATLYINGVLVPSSKLETGTYAGMSNTVQPVYLGRYGTLYSDGEIKQVQLFNRELTAAEVVSSMNGDLGFADEWGSNTELSNDPDFTVGSYTAVGGASVDTGAGTATIPGASGYIHISSINGSPGGKKYRLTYTIDSVSGTPNTYIYEAFSSNSINASRIALSNTAGTYHVEFDGKASGTNTVIAIYNDAASSSVTISLVSVRQIGTLLDARASNFDEDTDKLYDESSNAFIAVNSGSTLVGRALPVYETGTWTPSVTFGGGSTGVTYTAADGYYTRVGNICFFRGAVILSSKGSDTGLWVINGLPYTSESVGINSSMVQVYLTTANGLTSVPFGLVGDGTTDVTLFENGSTGATVLTDANAQNTTTMRISGTYQIQ